MKKSYRSVTGKLWANAKLLVSGLALFAGISAQAQVSAYSFTQTSGTYAPISGGTVLGVPTNDDTSFPNNPIGFTFWYNGASYTSFSVNSNGFIALGNAVNSSYTALSTGSTNNVIAALNADIQGEPVTGDLRFQTIGSAPNRTLVVQWSNYDDFSSTTGTDVYNFQIRLQETTNVVEVVYGANSSNQVAGLFQVGLRGNTAADFNNREVVNGVHTWSTSVAGASNASSCEMNPTLAPASGQTYSWTPSSPASPVNLTFSAVGITGMTLNWDDNSTDENSFAVYQSTDNINFTLTGTVPSTTSATTGTAYNLPVTGLSSNTLYYWRVYAVSNAPSAPLVGQQSTLPGTLCGTITVGPTGTYPSLTAAFAAVQTNGLLCPVIFELQAAYVSTVETFPITIPYLGTSSALTITVRPELGATNLSITSTAAQTLFLNGCTYLTFDGRPGGTGTIRQLTLNNTVTTGSTMLFQGGSSNNSVTYCNVLGANASTTSGVVVFGQGVPNVTGNNNNSFTNNDIGNGISNPTNLIYGSSASANAPNTGNTFNNNTFHDWFSATLATNAMNILGGNHAWTVTNNSFYQTSPLTYTTGQTHTIVNLSTGSGSTTGSHTVSNNFFGGSAPNCGGTAYAMNGTIATRFIAIQMNTGTGGANIIQGNTIRNFTLSTSSGASTTNGIWCAINLLGTSGSNVVGGSMFAPNIIGSLTTTGSIATSSSTTGGLVVAINSSASGSQTISYNQIGGIAANTTSGTISSSVIGIQISSGTAITIELNEIGSATVANNMVNAISTGTTGGQMTGIISTAFISSLPGTIIRNNLVRNLNNRYAGTSTAGLTRGIVTTSGISTIHNNEVGGLVSNSPQAGTITAASVIGISHQATTSGANHQVYGNFVHSLANSSLTGNVQVIGINLTGNTINQTLAYQNTVTGLGIASATGIVHGMQINGGLVRMYNNMITLGVDATGAPLTIGNEFNGITKNTANRASILFNTVSIGGTGVATGAGNTYAFRRLSGPAAAPADSVLSNIFDNRRSNGASTGAHYSAGLNATTGLVIDYNNYYGNGTGYATGIIGTTPSANFSAWQGATAQDQNSISVVNNFVSATNLHINPSISTALESRGFTASGINIDIDNDVRPGPVPSVNGGGIAHDIGADEVDAIPVLVDVGATLLVNPITTGCYTANETVRVRIRNYATATLNMSANPVTVSGAVTGPNPATFGPLVISSGTLAPLATLDTAIAINYNMTAAGTYVFTASATQASDPINSNDAMPPVTINISGGNFVVANGGQLCLGDSVRVVVTGYTNNGTIQWQSSPDGIVWTNVIGATNDSVYMTPNDTLLYRAQICGLHFSTIDTLFPQFVAPPVTVNDTICGVDTAFLSATGTGLRWYDAATGGNQIASGTSYSLYTGVTDTFYVAASTGTPPTAVTTTLAAGNGSSGNAFRISALNTITITAIDGHMTSGTANWEIWGRPGDYTLVPGSTTSNAGWTLLGSATGVVAAGLGVPTPLPIPLNVTIPGGTDYSFIVTTTGPTLNYTNGTAVGNPYVTNGDLIFREGHGGSYFGYTITTRIFNGRIHYSSGCESTRTPVIAVVNPAPAVNLTSTNNICGSGSSTLTAASSNNGYVFNWNPSNSLNIATGDTVIASPTVTTTYMVTASDSVSGCIDTTSITVIFDVAPAIAVSASPDTLCSGTTTQLDVAFSGPNPVIVGTSNTLNTATTYPAPYGNFWWGSRHQMLITAADLNAAGLTAGFINGLSFEVTNPNGTQALNNFEIKLGTTSLGAITTFQTTPMTTVFTTPSHLPVNGVNTHTFQTPFYWDGVSNLLVETCHQNSSFTDNASMRQTPTAYNSTVWYNADATGVCGNNTTNGFAAQRPNMRFWRSNGAWEYAWTPSSSLNNATAQNPIGTPMTTGYYVVTVTDSISGCATTDSIQIVVNPTPMPNFGPDTAICSSSPLVLDGTAGNYTYLWQDNSTNQTFTVTSFGIYNVLVTDTASGCFGTDTILVGVNPTPVFTLGGDATVCAGSNVTFSGPGGPYDYDWNTGDSVIAITVNTTGSYILVVTDQNNGCSATDTVVFTANPLPPVALGADTSYCANNAIVLTAPAGNFTYVWSDNSTNDSLSVSTTGTYFVTVTDTATTCFNADTVTIVINATPVVALGADTTFCSANGPLTLNAPAGPYNYLWSDNSNGASLAVNSSGTYAVAVTDSVNGCITNDSINVVVNASPNAVLADTSSCGNGITLTAAGGNYTYLWSDNTTGQSTTVTVSGNVSVVVTDTANGCAITDAAIVNINTPPTATVTASAANVCADDANVTLTGAPAGGVFVGTSVTGNAFDPSVGAGSYAVDYIYTDANGCTDTATTTIVVSACVGVEEAFFGVGMNVYPNPNNGQFTFTCSDANFTTMTFEVISMDGKVVLAEQASNVQGQYRRDMNMYNLANGVYYFRVIADGQTYMQKIVKQD